MLDNIAVGVRIVVIYGHFLESIRYLANPTKIAFFSLRLSSSTYAKVTRPQTANSKHLAVN